MKSGILSACALALGTIALTGCGGDESEPAPEASPDGFPGAEVSNARIVLPAVAGNPAAGYFDLDYIGDRVAMIRAASVEGAESTMMHSTREAPDGTMSMDEVLQLKVESGQTLKFEPGGYHLMAMGLPNTLQPGGTAEITLTFLGGDKLSFPAEVRAAGDAD